MEKSIYSKEYSLVLDQLRNTRQEKGLTQTDVAKRLGQTQSFVSKVERKERRIDVVELRAFCEALGVSFLSFVAQADKTLNDSNE